MDEGREADKRGRWRVGRVLGIRRPAHRRGRQLEVQIEWAGVDTASGHAWGVAWIPIMWCTVDVRVEARRLEQVQFPCRKRAAAAVASRKSPRLAGEAAAGWSEEEDSDEEGGGEGEGGGGSGGGAIVPATSTTVSPRPPPEGRLRDHSSRSWCAPCMHP